MCRFEQCFLPVSILLAEPLEAIQCILGQSAQMFWGLWLPVVLQQLQLNKWSFSLNIKMNNTISTWAPSVCIPFISGQHSLFLMFPYFQWKKAVTPAKEKLGKIWRFHVQKEAWGDPTRLLETISTFQCPLCCEFRLKCFKFVVSTPSCGQWSWYFVFLFSFFSPHPLRARDKTATNLLILFLKLQT